MVDRYSDEVVKRLKEAEAERGTSRTFTKEEMKELSEAIRAEILTGNKS